MTIKSTTEAETLVRQFAAQFPTPNVRAALDHCVTGRLAWTAVADLFERSLAAGLEQSAETPSRADAERTVTWTHQQYELNRPITPAQRGAYERAVELLDQEV